MTSTVQQALANLSLQTDERIYRFIRLPTAAVPAAAGMLAQIRDPFLALMVDSREITLVVADDEIEDFQSRLRDAEISGPFRLITFDVDFGLDVVGFAALFTRALADAGVPIMPLASYHRDHVLIPAEHFHVAWEALLRLRTAP
jgi:hypothetical protein